MKGWELVQVLRPGNDVRYHLGVARNRAERTFNPGLRPTYSTERGRTLARTALWFSS